MVCGRRQGRAGCVSCCTKERECLGLEVIYAWYNMALRSIWVEQLMEYCYPFRRLLTRIYAVLNPLDLVFARL